MESSAEKSDGTPANVPPKPVNVERLAELLGAQHVATLPDVGPGAFGAARLAHIIAELQRRPKADE